MHTNCCFGTAKITLSWAHFFDAQVDTLSWVAVVFGRLTSDY